MNAAELRDAIATSAAYATESKCIDREDRLSTFVAYLAGFVKRDEPALYEALWATLQMPRQGTFVTPPVDA